MALNVDKLKQTNTVSTPVSTSTDTSTRTNKKPIDFNYKNGENTETDNDILASINSKECKGLKDEAEKIEWLRQNNPSLKGASDKDIKNYITLAQQIEEENKSKDTSVTTSSSPTVENKDETLTTEETNSVAVEFNEQETPAMRQFNKKTTEYLKSINYNGSIENYIQEVSTKEISELTNVEKGILQEFKAANLPPAKNSAKNNELFNVHQLLSPQFTKLNNEQKLKELSKIFLSANDSKYTELSPKEKAKYEKDTVETLKKLINYNEKNNLTSSLNAVALLQYAHTTGKTIDDLSKLKKENINEIINNSVENIINVTLKEIKNIPGESNVEKVNKFADAILMATDKEYEKLKPGKEKDAYRNAKIKEFFNDIGIPVDSISNATHMHEEELFKNLIEIVSKLSKNGDLLPVLKEFQSDDPKLKTQAFNKVITSLPDDLKQKYKTSIEIMKVTNDVKITIGKKDLTGADIYKYLKNKPNLSEVEKNLLEMYSRLDKIIDLKEDNIDLKLINEVAAEMSGMGIDEYITTTINNANFNRGEGGLKQIKQLIASAHASGNVDQLKLIENLLNNRKDINPKLRKKFNALLSAETFAKTGFSAMIVHNNGTEAAKATCMLEKKNPEMAIKVTRMMPACAKDETAWSKFAEGTFHSKHLRTAAAQGLNDLPDRVKANRYALAAANNSNIADSYKSQFTKELIVDAKRLGTEEQLRYAKTLSQVNNPAVTEGLAAASKSVDSSARQQYDSYVDNAMKNYTPEQQAAIRQARETGEISSSTLAQTNTSNGKPIENSGSSSNASSNTSGSTNSVGHGTGSASAPASANNAAGSNTAQASGGSANAPASSSANQSGISTANQTSRSASANKTVSSSNNKSSVAASVSSSSASPISSSKTQTSNSPSAVDANDSEVSTESKTTTLPTISPEETQKLKEEAQVLMDRIEEFMETQAESIQAYEEEQSKKLESRFEDIVAELTGETEVYSDLNISKYENLPQELKNDIKEYFQDLYEKNGINAIYNALDGNKKDSFVERLASTKSHEAIMAFANEHRSDRGIIKTLFKYSQNSELIRFMDSADIIDLYMKGQIQDINLIKNNSEALAKIIELQLKGGEEPRNLKGLYALLTAEFQSDILANYPALAEEIPGTDAHYAKHIQSMKTAPSTNPNPAIAATNSDSGMITLENEIPAEHENPYIYDKGDGHSVTLPFGRDYDRQKKKGHIYFA